MEHVDQGYFSLLRWRRDPSRDECRNVAVMLVSPDGKFGGIRPAPISSFSQNIRQQGILDAVVQSLRRQFEGEVKPDVAMLSDLSESFQERSLLITEPEPAAVPDPELALEALYKALVQPTSGGNPQAKGAVLDRVVTSFRRKGYGVRRGEYLRDFLFDAVVTGPDAKEVMLEVLSFTSPKVSWIAEERDAGHFLYGLQQVDGQGFGIIQPPAGHSRDTARDTYQRVLRWFDRAGVESTEPAALADRTLESMLVS